MSEESGNPGPGAELGPFRIGNRLGVGGMGIVFQALDTHLNRQVALKIITPHIGEDADFRARFTREAQAQASLDSPHVVQVYSFGEADGRLYIASQLIPDGDLGQMLHKHGRPPARIAVNLISQVADGLSDAHNAGLIHRDIKPANVLLRNREGQLHAYLGDFGIARQVGASQLTQAGGTVGTPSYMAPELHLGGEAGPASDIYSLGCLLWATLSGKAPYVGSTDYQVVMAHVEKPIPQLALTGPLAAEINRVLRTAMAKNPAERYRSAAAMRDDLKNVVRLPDDPTPARPADGAATTPVPAQPWSFAPLPTPTPTPTPTPSPVSQAPAAPAFQTPSPPPPSFSSTPPGGYHPTPTPSSSGSGGGSGAGKAGWVVAVVLVLLLAGGAVLAAVLISGGDDNGGGGGGGGGSSETAGPTDSGTGGGETGDREEQAAQALRDDIVADDPTTDPASADCIARGIVREVGVDKLVEIGVLTDDLEVNQAAGNPEDAAELVSPMLTVTFECIGSLIETPSS
ncbi:serine/threonine-protein kinase [Nocardioides sp. C4-1]|uniref:serine/threonine-protein kinase n=1 Tax=Nocardioides sp. C4-1 TaxID=3151851 RepID=UPI003264EF59